ncbi:hypothetical protein [Nostocoides japonicum]|uniref:hypothetical protein n=1 Tax=Nostocoides japonicum TaxID=99481 RepID=UPI001F1FB595|nr:hypothetical protein [Tetrasphaera japonica]
MVSEQVNALRNIPIGDPLWRDVDALRAVFGELVDGRVERRVRMGRHAYNAIREPWAMANGFESKKDPGRADWHALRAFLEGGIARG